MSTLRIYNKKILTKTMIIPMEVLIKEKQIITVLININRRCQICNSWAKMKRKKKSGIRRKEGVSVLSPLQVHKIAIWSDRAVRESPQLTWKSKVHSKMRLDLSKASYMYHSKISSKDDDTHLSSSLMP